MQIRRVWREEVQKVQKVGKYRSTKNLSVPLVSFFLNINTLIRDDIIFETSPLLWSGCFVQFLVDTCVLSESKCLKSTFLDLILHLLLVNTAFLSLIEIQNLYNVLNLSKVDRSDAECAFFPALFVLRGTELRFDEDSIKDVFSSLYYL